MFSEMKRCSYSSSCGSPLLFFFLISLHISLSFNCTVPEDDRVPNTGFLGRRYLHSTLLHTVGAV